MTSHLRDDTIVRAVPVLQELARSVTGDPQAALGRLLTLVCEQLTMDVAFVSLSDGAGSSTVRTSARADGTPGPVGLEVPLTPEWCGQVVSDGVLDASGSASFARVPLHDEIPWVDAGGPQMLDLDRALGELEKLDAEQAQMFEVRFLLGCTSEETAELFSVSKSSVERKIRVARAWLFQRLSEGKIAPAAPDFI